jgi:hypothetical protein
MWQMFAERREELMTSNYAPVEASALADRRPKRRIRLRRGFLPRGIRMRSVKAPAASAVFRWDST